MTYALASRPVTLPERTFFLFAFLVLFAFLASIHPHATTVMTPQHLVGGLDAGCGAAIGFGVVAGLALAAGTGGFGAALGVSLAIHVALLAC